MPSTPNPYPNPNPDPDPDPDPDPGPDPNPDPNPDPTPEQAPPTEVDALVNSAHVCLGGVGAGLRFLVGVASGGAMQPPSLSGAAVARAAAGWAGECSFSVRHSLEASHP